MTNHPAPHAPTAGAGPATGTPVTACPRCGTLAASADASFCEECGRALRGEQPADPGGASGAWPANAGTADAGTAGGAGLGAANGADLAAGGGAGVGAAGDAGAGAAGVAGAGGAAESDGLDGTPTAGGQRRPAPSVRRGPGGSRWASSTVEPVACAGCGSTAHDEDGYCTGCGQRQATGADRAVLVLETVAGVTDRGIRKRRNEDATAIGELPGATLVVVCDGVSSSSRADSAAHAAVDAAMPALLDAVVAGTPDSEATVLAAAEAQRAVAAAASSSAETNPPSSTYVSAIVRDGAITLGWIGDSRAYWLPPDLPATEAAGGPATETIAGPTAEAAGGPAGAGEDDGESAIGVLTDGAELSGPARLTVDDSFAGQLAAAGVPVHEAQADPQAGALVRWLGADADAAPPSVATFRPAAPGRLVVCSDGLSRYRRTAAELADSTPAGTPVGTATDLVQLARDSGGVDNITVVLVPYPVAGTNTTSDAPSRETS